MTVAVIQGDRHILDSRRTVCIVYLADAPAEITHRIICAGYHKDRQSFGDMGDLGAILRRADTAEHALVGIDCKDESTGWIGDVAVNDRCIFRQPVRRGAGRFKFFVVAAEGQVVDKMAAVSGSMEQGGQAAEENPKVQDHARLGSRSHNDGPGKSRSVPADVLPCQERSHTVSQQEIRDMGIFLLCQCPQGVDISEHAGVAVWFREISAVFFIRYGGAVPQVIVSGDQIALFAEKVGKLFISPDKFAHAVTDLQYSPDVSLRDPFDRVNPGFLIG